MLHNSSRTGGFCRSAIAFGIAFLGFSAFGPAAQATTLTGTFNIEVYQADTNSGNINDSTQQASLSNPLLLNLPDYSGTFTGALNLSQGGSGAGSLAAFLNSSGAALTGTLATIPNSAVLSTASFDITTVFKITGTTVGAISGAITHDDGMTLYNALLNPVAASALPVSATATPYSFAGGAFTLIYVEANALPAVLNFDVTEGNASTTPLPGALPLFVSGVGLVGLIARRRKKKAAVLA